MKPSDKIIHNIKKFLSSRISEQTPKGYAEYIDALILEVCEIQQDTHELTERKILKVVSIKDKALAMFRERVSLTRTDKRIIRTVKNKELAVKMLSNIDLTPYNLKAVDYCNKQSQVLISDLLQKYNYELINRT